jgi:RNA polymerase sigma-70 factor (ECF subfamily)
MDDPNHAQPWDRWFNDHGPRLLLFARQQTRSEADAHDVLQDALVRLFRSGRARHDEPPALQSVFAAIRHAALDRGRRESRREAREARAGESVPAVDWFERSLEREERRSALQAALGRLPREQQEVLTLKIWGEMTFAQIAEMLGLSPNTAASRYQYALQALRRTLDPSQP